MKQKVCGICYRWCDGDVCDSCAPAYRARLEAERVHASARAEGELEERYRRIRRSRGAEYEPKIHRSSEQGRHGVAKRRPA